MEEPGNDKASHPFPLPLDRQTTDRHDLTFTTLYSRFSSVLGIESPGLVELNCLGLASGNAFTNAAVLFSDQNTYPGIEMTLFENAGASTRTGTILESGSLVAQYENALDRFLHTYRPTTNGNDGTTPQARQIPESAFEEAIIYAIVQRDYSINARIRIDMYPDHVEISSPGGLVNGFPEEAYLSSPYTPHRNDNVNTVFTRLGLMPYLYAGPPRIKKAYNSSVSKPRFKVSDSELKTLLPRYLDLETLLDNLGKNEREAYLAIRYHPRISTSVIARETGFGKTKTVSLVNSLIEKGLVKAIGNGRSRVYELAV